MQFSNILIPILLIMLTWNSHVAGAALARQADNTRMKNVAVGRSIFSIAIGALVVFLAWK